MFDAISHRIGDGERLKEIRQYKDLSQGNIEKRTGLLRCYVSPRRERPHTLGKWSQALGVSMAELFSENGQTPKALEVPATKTKKLDRASANALRRLSQALVKMNPKDRALLVSFANKLASRS